MTAPSTHLPPHLRKNDKFPESAHKSEDPTSTSKAAPFEWKDEGLSPEKAGNTSIQWTKGCHYSVSAANDITSNDIDTQLADMLEPDHDPMRIDSQSDVGQFNSSSPSSGTHSRRTTIVIDSVAPETLTTVMQILLIAKAKVKIETE